MPPLPPPSAAAAATALLAVLRGGVGGGADSADAAGAAEGAAAAAPLDEASRLLCLRLLGRLVPAAADDALTAAAARQLLATVGASLWRTDGGAAAAAAPPLAPPPPPGADHRWAWGAPPRDVAKLPVHGVLARCRGGYGAPRRVLVPVPTEVAGRPLRAHHLPGLTPDTLLSHPVLASAGDVSRPPPSGSAVWVVGAGLAEFSGTYVPDGSSGGATRYRISSGGDQTMNRSGDGCWYLCHNHSGYWYRAQGGTDRPPTSGWEAGSDGRAPAPSIAHRKPGAATGERRLLDDAAVRIHAAAAGDAWQMVEVQLPADDSAAGGGAAADADGGASVYLELLEPASCWLSALSAAPPQVLAAKFSEKLKYNARLVGGGSGVTFNSDGAAMVEHGPECIKWASGVYSVEFRCTRRTRADGSWIGVHYVDDARVGRVVDAGLGQRRHLRTHRGVELGVVGGGADGRITSPPLVRASGSRSRADDLKWGENDVLTLTLDSHSMTLRLAKNGRPLDGRIERGSGQMGSHRSGGLFFSVGRYYGELHVTLNSLTLAARTGADPGAAAAAACGLCLTEVEIGPSAEASAAASAAAAAASRPPPPPLQCPRGHVMVADARSRNSCDLRDAPDCCGHGTAWRCSGGCDYDVCEPCWVHAQAAAVEAAAEVAPPLVSRTSTGAPTATTAWDLSSSGRYAVLRHHTTALVVALSFSSNGWLRIREDDGREFVMWTSGSRSPQNFDPLETELASALEQSPAAPSRSSAASPTPTPPAR